MSMPSFVSVFTISLFVCVCVFVVIYADMLTGCLLTQSNLVCKYVHMLRDNWYRGKQTQMTSIHSPWLNALLF